MSIGIVFYSLSNNTKTAAEFIARETGGELIPLKENTSRDGFAGFMKSGFQAATKRMSAVEGEPWKAAESHATIYLLTPIWASNGTPAMNTFLEHAELSGKHVIVVTFQADPNKRGSEKVHEHIRSRVEKTGGTVAETHAFVSAKPGVHAGQDAIEKQVRTSL